MALRKAYDIRRRIFTAGQGGIWQSEETPCPALFAGKNIRKLWCYCLQHPIFRVGSSAWVR